MKIGLVSFAINSKDRSTAENHPDYFLKIVNKYDRLDIIVFSGWTILKEDLERIKNEITNKNSLILFEAWNDIYEGEERHKGYYFREGNFYNNDIVQIFATSNEISSDRGKMGKYLEHTKEKRIIAYKKKNICWIICGEINVLKNIQSENNRVLFRFENDNFLKDAFDGIYKKTDIFINPTHTIMGNQGKLKKRREYLSRSNKIFCSVSNADIANGEKLDYKSIQYLYRNGEEINGEEVYRDNEVILKKYIVA